MIGWEFPLNGYGRGDGYNDPGIETFKGNRSKSLAREVIQNSLDARISDQHPAVVDFQLVHFPAEKYPNIIKFKAILKSCLKISQSRPKAKTFFEKAIEVLNQQQIPILKISDYNTTGLTGSSIEFDDTTHWYNLTKGVGSSNKDGMSGGSFGIGKNAPFALSQLRTVFYGTKDKYGKCAFQGVSKLITHHDDEGRTTQGTGFYGIKERIRPIIDTADIDTFFRRNEVGSDLFVAGFYAESDWQERTIKSVIENFFIAIMQGKLEVKVSNIMINSDSLPQLMDSYIQEDKECLADVYYDASKKEDHNRIINEDFEGYGRIELFVALGNDLPKKVAMVRSTGMKIRDKGFRLSVPFAGVLLASGEKLNKILRDMENPAHTDWEPERSELLSEGEAKKIIKSLYQWVRDQIVSLVQNEHSDNLDIDGLSHYLPDDFDEEDAIAVTNETEGEIGSPKPIEITATVRRAINEYRTARGQVAATTSTRGGTDVTPNPSSPPNINPNPPILPNNEPGSEGGGHHGSKPGINGGSHNTGAVVKFKKKRVFCTNPDTGTWKVVFETDTPGNGVLVFKVVGEEGKEPASIKSATVQANGEPLPVDKNGKIGPFPFKAGDNILTVILDDTTRCSLEVLAYEN